MNCLAGIVTFNPDLNRLFENYNAISQQVDKVIFVDNNSSNIKDILRFCEEKDITIFSYKENKGIACALKEIMEYAIRGGYDWVVTLDQDSVAKGGIIKEYQQYIADPLIGALTCNVTDRNYIDKKQYSARIEEVGTCLTSGCFMRVSAYKDTAGYDVRMFIDCVDFDICYSLRAAGYKIVRIPYDGLIHEIGNGRNIRFLGRNTMVFNHPAWRRYYANRNMIYIAKKHPRQLRMTAAMGRCVYRTIVIAIYEKDKINKFIFNIKGIIDGIKMKQNERKCGD